MEVERGCMIWILKNMGVALALAALLAFALDIAG